MSTPSENIVRKMNNTDDAIRNLFKNITGREYHATPENIQDFRESVTREKQQEMNLLLEQKKNLTIQLRRLNPTGVLGVGNMGLATQVTLARLQAGIKKGRRSTRKNRRTTKKTRMNRNRR
jgi:hypothetical protein